MTVFKKVFVIVFLNSNTFVLRISIASFSISLNIIYAEMRKKAIVFFTIAFLTVFVLLPSSHELLVSFFIYLFGYEQVAKADCEYPPDYISKPFSAKTLRRTTEYSIVFNRIKQVPCFNCEYSLDYSVPTSIQKNVSGFAAIINRIFPFNYSCSLFRYFVSLIIFLSYSN